MFVYNNVREMHYTPSSSSTSSSPLTIFYPEANILEKETGGGDNTGESHEAALQRE